MATGCCSASRVGRAGKPRPAARRCTWRPGPGRGRSTITKPPQGLIVDLPQPRSAKPPRGQDDGGGRPKSGGPRGKAKVTLFRAATGTRGRRSQARGAATGPGAGGAAPGANAGRSTRGPGRARSREESPRAEEGGAPSRGQTDRPPGRRANDRTRKHGRAEKLQPGIPFFYKQEPATRLRRAREPEGTAEDHRRVMLLRKAPRRARGRAARSPQRTGKGERGYREADTPRSEG